jgi:hypothetical protein
MSIIKGTSGTYTFLVAPVGCDIAVLDVDALVAVDVLLVVDGGFPPVGLPVPCRALMMRCVLAQGTDMKH